jgi:hypothetical protein
MFALIVKVEIGVKSPYKLNVNLYSFLLVTSKNTKIIYSIKFKNILFGEKKVYENTKEI